MSRKILFFFPHNLYPAKSGAHKNTLEILAGLRDMGCGVTLVGSALHSDNKWTESSVQSLTGDWVDRVRVYQPTLLDYCAVAPVIAACRLAETALPIDSMAYAPPGMRRWFDMVLHEVEPDTVFMNYAHWDGLLDHQRLSSLHRIIHTHDLISLNRRMQEAVKPHLRRSLTAATDSHDPMLQEDYFEKLNLTADPKETDIYDKYDRTIAVSAPEAAFMQQRTHQTEVVLSPVTQEPCYIPNSYTGGALFPIGPNPFNLQGYLYFVRRVLPHVLQHTPSFSLQVTGSWYRHWRPRPEVGVVLRGFVPDLKAVYESSRFVVCPVFGQTGQQVKIVEAMAHGVPVIALSAAAARSPIQHGVNGLIAGNAGEFADHVVRLWGDRDLCRRLGAAARETIAKQCSRLRLLDDLSLILV